VTGDDLVIETEALTKRFRRRTALNECSLSVPRGRIAALVGPTEPEKRRCYDFSQVFRNHRKEESQSSAKRCQR